ncbi:MAG: hypothetical protein H5T82_01665, partial [Demequina sp.]|nr:hypothetical protein [Demequina sp.]
MVFATDNPADFVPTFWCRTDNAGYCRIRAMTLASIPAHPPEAPEIDLPSIDVTPLSVTVEQGSRREHDLAPWLSTPPGPSDDAIMTLSSFTEDYRMFWTYSADVFAALQTRMTENYVAAMREYPFRLIEPRTLGPWRRDFTIPDNPIDQREQKRVSYFLSARENVRYMPVYQERANSPDFDVLQSQESRDHRFYREYCANGPIFDVTPEPLRALYLAEWAQAYEIQLREQSAVSWSKLLRVRHVVRAAEDGSAIDGLQERLENAMSFVPRIAVPLELTLPTMVLTPERVAAQNVADQEQRRRKSLWADRFRRYAWECARAGVPRDLLRNAIKIGEIAPHMWQERANTIFHSTAPNTHGPCLHPWHDPGAALREILGGAVFDDVALDGDAQDCLLEYFDFYRFGFRARTRQYAADLETRLDEIDTAFGWVAQNAAARLMQVSSHAAFRDAAGQQAPHDLFYELMARHTRACALHRIRWWESLEPPPADDVRLKAMLKAVVSAAGRGASFQDNFLKEFLTKQVKTYRWSAEQAEDLLNRMYRYTVALDALQGETATPERLPQMTSLELEVDFRNGVVTTRGALASADSVRLQFLTQLEAMPEGEAVRAFRAQQNGTPASNDRIRTEYRLARDAGQVRTFRVEVPGAARVPVQRFRWGN